MTAGAAAEDAGGACGCAPYTSWMERVPAMLLRPLNRNEVLAGPLSETLWSQIISHIRLKLARVGWQVIWENGAGIFRSRMILVEPRLRAEIGLVFPKPCV